MYPCRQCGWNETHSTKDHTTKNAVDRKARGQQNQENQQQAQVASANDAAEKAVRAMFTKMQKVHREKRSKSSAPVEEESRDDEALFDGSFFEAMEAALKE